jgi:hypothetical protein
MRVAKMRGSQIELSRVSRTRYLILLKLASLTRKKHLVAHNIDNYVRQTSPMANALDPDFKKSLKCSGKIRL